jgi:hypothetical protein
MLPLLVAATAGAAQPDHGPLHPKSAAGQMHPVYLATPAQAAEQRARLDTESASDVFAPFAVLDLDAPAYSATATAGLTAIGADAALLRLGWNDGLTVAQALPTVTSADFLAALDVNSDGRTDLAAIRRTANTLGWSARGADGTLGGLIQRPIPANAEALTAADLTGDCRDDLAFTTPDGTLHVLPQARDGTFDPELVGSFPNGGATDLAAGDLNHDGRNELAALRGTGGVAEHVALYRVAGGAVVGLGGRTVEDGDFAAHAVAIGDVTGDGRADLVIGAGGNAPDAYLNVFVQDSSGQLATTPQILPASHIPEAVAIADVNHDSINDVVALNSGWLTLSLYLGQPDGSLAPYELVDLPYSAAYRPETLALGDLNGDGGLDVLIADGARGATYLLNQESAPTATIATPTPCAEIRDKTLTLSGTITGGTALEVSLDGGLTWQAATVAGATWSFSTTITNSIYPRVLARARDGARFQAPPASVGLVFRQNQSYLPLTQR